MRIAIVGSGSNKHRAPFGEPDWQIWTLSPKNADKREIPRHDAWFELHDHNHIKGLGVDYGAWLRTLPRIYMRPDVASLYPGGVPYDIKAKKARYGEWFFEKSQLPLIAAEALDHFRARPGEHHMLWWAGISTDTPEYARQWPEVRHFNQLARDLGVELVAPGCKILDPLPTYHNWD